MNIAPCWLILQSSCLYLAQELLTSGVCFYPMRFLPYGTKLLAKSSSVHLLAFSTSLCKDQKSTLGAHYILARG